MAVPITEAELVEGLDHQSEINRIHDELKSQVLSIVSSSICQTVMIENLNKLRSVSESAVRDALDVVKKAEHSLRMTQKSREGTLTEVFLDLYRMQIEILAHVSSHLKKSEDRDLLTRIDTLLWIDQSVDAQVHHDCDHMVEIMRERKRQREKHGY